MFELGSIGERCPEIAYKTVRVLYFLAGVEGDPGVCLDCSDPILEKALDVAYAGGPAQAFDKTSERIFSIHQMGLVALVGNGDGRGHSRNAAADDQRQLDAVLGRLAGLPGDVNYSIHGDASFAGMREALAGDL